MAGITRTTPLKDFPDIYNADRRELIERIEELEKNNLQARIEYENKTKELIILFNRLATQLQNTIDSKLDEFESKFIKIDEVGDSDSD